jgi:hypothetical protein
MKILFAPIFFLASVVLNASSQQGSTDNQRCQLFSKLHFKHGSATIIVKAKIKGVFRSPDQPVFSLLARGKYLVFKEYFSTCCGGTSINFIPEDCSEAYDSTVRRNIKFDIYHFKNDDTIYLTCIVFEKFKDPDSKYFFVIDNISAMPPKNKKAT